MLTILQYFTVACAVVFIAGAGVTIALVPFAIRGGLLSLKKKDISDFIASTNQVPSVLRAILVIRRVQSVAWWSLLCCILALTGWAIITGSSLK